jgi:anti-sigma factor RsiW
MSEMHLTPEQLVEYLHRELPAPRDASVHEHLAECASCAQAYEAEAALTEQLRAHARSQERELPARVVTAIRAAIEQPRTLSAWEGLGAALRPVIAVPATAVIAAALYFGISAWHGASATSIRAAEYVNSHAALTGSSPFSEDPPVPAVLTSDTIAAQQPADGTR